jgi:hypothetical protein
MTFFFIAYMISWLSTASTYPMQQWLEIARFGGYLVQLLLGLYLFFGAKWIVNKAIPSNRPYCPECGYDLSKSRGDVCPECGVALPRTAPPIDTP